MQKIESALLYKSYYGKAKLIGKVTPEEYQATYGSNRDDIVLKCPCHGIDGKPCGALLEFTNGGGGRVSYFSTKDNNKHRFGCILTTDGLKRKQPNESYIRKDLDFGSFLLPAKKGDTSDESDDSLSVGEVTGVDELKLDTENGIGDGSMLDGLDAGELEDDFDLDTDSEEKMTQKRQIEEKPRGFKGFVLTCLEAGPADAASNGFLISDQMICYRTAGIFHDGLIKIEKGDPLLLFARKWGQFSAEYSSELDLGNNVRIMRSLYFQEYTNIYAIKLNGFGKSEWEKFNKIYNRNEEKGYRPEGFVMGVVYEGTESHKVGGKKRNIEIFSLMNIRNMIVYDDNLKKIDEENCDI